MNLIVALSFRLLVSQTFPEGSMATPSWWLAVSRYRGATARKRARRAIEARIRQLVEAGIANRAATP